VLLKGWMAKTGTGLEELAKKADLSVSFLCNIQNGKALPKLDTFKRLVDTTGLDAYELMVDTLRLYDAHGPKG
jgi:predicted transcriptional regulator